jgi:predicted metal-dependent phosphoesterase TrpH
LYGSKSDKGIPTWLLGDIHLHSSYSGDGEGSLESIKTRVLNPGSEQAVCDFLVITDHLWDITEV